MINSEIILCSDIKLDRSYENVLSYNEEQMVSLCRSKAIYTGTEYKIVGVRENKINVSARYEDCIYANYMAFINRKYANKWFFAWVTDVKLLNPATTEITFQIDVFSTWYQRFTYNQAFIEREHVDDDTIGLHTLPENLETGEYVVNYENINSQFNTLDIIVASNIDTAVDGQGELVGGHVYGGTYNRIKQGYKYYYFSNNASSSLNDILKKIDDAGYADNINFMFLAPFNSFEKDDATIIDNGKVKENYLVKYMDWENVITGDTAPTKLRSLDGYQPVNNKLLTFPFCYLRVSNNNGGDAIFHFEKFADNEANKCYFQFICAICPGMSINLFPLSYDNITNNFNECLPAGKFPICGFSSDVYTNWLTQNGVNIVSNLVGGALQTAVGVGGTVAGGGVGMASLGASGLGTIKDTLTTIYEHSFNPIQSRGATNTGDVKTSANINTFTAYGMSIKEEYARVIDQYFSRFGYQVNTVKTPNLNSRLHFNFIKVGGQDELVHGNIPASALEEINGVFRKGVTIFHDYDSIGNYTINNPIVQ